MAYDLIIRGGTVVDGSGTAGCTADVAISGDRIAEVGRVGANAARVIDASGCIVSPGFIDIHTHLDAQIHWDPLATSGCWHGVTSVVMGNCGVTFAPCRPADRDYLARLMESVEDIPAATIMQGLRWNWETYGEFLDALDGLPKGINAGGLVGHCALRIHAMGERGLTQKTAGASDVERICGMVDEAMSHGALGFSTSRLLVHRTPDGESIPGTWATEDELFAIGRVLGARGKGVFMVVPRLEGREDPLPAEVEWMLRLGREIARPVTFAHVTLPGRPGAWRAILEQVRQGNSDGAVLFPQTQVRSVGALFGLLNASPWDHAGGEWAKLRRLPVEQKLEALRESEFRRALVREAESRGPVLSAPFMRTLYLLREHDGGMRYDFRPEDSLTVIAHERGISLPEAYLEVSRERQGRALFLVPISNADLDEVGELISDENVVLGLSDSGAHCGQIMDASLPTYLLSYWVRERALFSVEEAVRKLTSEPARLFGLRDRGVLRPGAFADVTVFEFDALRIRPPEFVRDFPLGAGRYVQRADGYRHAIVNGVPFLEGGEHTGALAGRTLRSTDH